MTFSNPSRGGKKGNSESPKSAKLRINFLSPLPVLATEIRCQEKSKGGLRYEVILAEPNLNQVPVPKAVQQNIAPKPSTAEEIAEKLKAAEERRLVRNFYEFHDQKSRKLF